MHDIVPTIGQDAVVTFHESLLAWFDDHERDLPWRADDVSAWQILISEIMLQQTPVARVIPKWLEWIERWPVPSAMARESVGEVVRAWGKLGYPRRAMRLHECATVLADRFDDEVPSDVDTLLTLPGVGDYTARAVACFAFDAPVPVVDINVRRVIARAIHGRGDAGSPARTDLADAQALLPPRVDIAPRFSAALMELGALVCTARTPSCAACPLPDCAWVQAGRPAVTTPKKVQRFAGTDRQVRGLILDEFRSATGPVERVRLDTVWTRDPGQRERALDSLLADGLVETSDGSLFWLAGEGTGQGRVDDRNASTAPR
ncbi:MAG: A/G-specific adenine glycosylase [Williamsia herbipolensis]|jgi:A/G-specific adenine glycosylase|uniref:A/G-specific adenine glycosylase n=1 Tax=Williamsia serinedens TaxID=391736 RepID=UPI001A02243C|nr:A/G-specific adenine glycosylase [Williamsia herbipolensis]